MALPPFEFVSPYTFKLEKPPVPSQVYPVPPGSELHIPLLGSLSSFVGAYVFLERAPDSYPANGEYLVVQQGTATLYVVKPVVGYGFNDLREFALMGDKPTRILTCKHDATAARRLALDNIEWSYWWKYGTVPQWIESVYSSARHNAALLLRNLGQNVPTFDRMPERVAEAETARKNGTKEGDKPVKTIKVFASGRVVVE